MTFKELQTALTIAMKERNRVKKNVIADMITCAKNMAIEQGCKDNITDEIVTAAILKSKKVCQEQIDTCPANRPDVLEAYKVCMSYIDEFAPKMMNEDETRKAIYHIIATTDIFQTGKGAIMKAVMPKLKGKADGKMINKIVSEIVAKTGE